MLVSDIPRVMRKTLESMGKARILMGRTSKTLTVRSEIFKEASSTSKTLVGMEKIPRITSEILTSSCRIRTRHRPYTPVVNQSLLGAASRYL